MLRAVRLLGPILGLILAGCGAPERAGAVGRAGTRGTSVPARPPRAPAGATQPAPTPSAAPPAAPEAPAAEAGVRAVVRFVCDEKYVAEEPCDEGAWLTEVESDPDARNLLDHDAGGPEGAVWNGNAPMVVIVPDSVSSVRVGGTDLEGTRRRGLRVFRVPANVWLAALRPVPGRAYRAAPISVDGKHAGEIWYAEGE
ncbi:MAG: hypothetical protein JNL21_36885 [Myxococcales bacterium]|nr:hypothetical protein [Myxococcales bacterium]